MDSIILLRPTTATTRVEYVDDAYHIWVAHDISRDSADRLALGVIDDGNRGTRDDPGLAAPFSLGRWNRFHCWFDTSEPGLLPGEGYAMCGVRLNGLPTALQELLADGKLGTALHVALAWKGLPQIVTARFILVRGVGYLTRKVLVPLKPSIEFIDNEGKVQWIAR